MSKLFHYFIISLFQYFTISCAMIVFERLLLVLLLNSVLVGIKIILAFALAANRCITSKWRICIAASELRISAAYLINLADSTSALRKCMICIHFREAFSYKYGKF